MKPLLLLALAVLAMALLVARARAQAATDAVRPRGAQSMAEVENEIRQFVRAQGERPRGEIRASASNGAIGFHGVLTTGGARRVEVDLAAPAETGGPRGGREFIGLLSALHDASLGSPSGPWYYLVLRAGPDDEIRFTYFLERIPLASIRELGLSAHETVPSHVYRQRFDAARVAELSDFEVNAGIAAHVPDRLAAGRPVSPALAELFATIDWEGDVNNGGMDQYFARRASDITRQPRSDLYPQALAGLRRIGAVDAAALYAESIALYAHFHDHVESARVAMGIPAQPRTTHSDIEDRYFALQGGLDGLRAAYLRAHPDVLEGSPGLR